MTDKERWSYRYSVRQLDALADSIRFDLSEEEVSNERIADEIVRIISELEERVGNIT